MRKRKRLLLIAGSAIVVLILTNPNRKDFIESCPTKTELQKNDYLIENVHNLEYKRKNNFFIFSIYEFHFAQIEKNRKIVFSDRITHAFGDEYGSFQKRNKIVKKRYFGLMKNFIEF
jgi:hypothetical protein